MFNCVIFNIFIKGYCLKGDVDKVLFLFLFMVKYSIRLNRVICNIFFYVLCKEGFVEGVRKFLIEIIDDGCEKLLVDLIILIIFMDCCFKNGDVVEVFYYWIKMW